MAIPPNAQVSPEAIDPRNVLDVAISLSQGPPDAKPAPFLLTGESVASFVLTLTPEALAAGLQIKADAPYPPPTITGLKLQFWLCVDPAKQGSPAFDGAGLPLAIECTATTDNNPPRVKQKTFVQVVANQ